MLQEDNKENSSSQFSWQEAFSSCMLVDTRMALEFGNSVDQVGQYVHPVVNQCPSTGIFYNLGYIENPTVMGYPKDVYNQNGGHPMAAQLG